VKSHKQRLVKTSSNWGTHLFYPHPLSFDAHVMHYGIFSNVPDTLRHHMTKWRHTWHHHQMRTSLEHVELSLLLSFAMAFPVNYEINPPNFLMFFSFTFSTEKFIELQFFQFNKMLDDLYSLRITSSTSWKLN